MLENVNRSLQGWVGYYHYRNCSRALGKLRLRHRGIEYYIRFTCNNLYKKLRSLGKDGILKSTEQSSEMGANRKYYVLTPFGKKFFKEVSKLMIPVIDSFYNRIHEFS